MYTQLLWDVYLETTLVLMARVAIHESRSYVW